VNGPDRRDRRPLPSDDPPADEEYARAYTSGYEEGVRSALREVVQHASRGHTSQELRMLAESRLARLPEEAELKRRGLLAPPRRTAWGALLRPHAPAADPRLAAAPAAVASGALGPGQSLLVREERPARAVEILRASAAAFPRVVVVSIHPPELAGLPSSRRIDLSPRGDPADRGGAAPTGLSELGGRLRAPTEGAGGALVYVDSLEYFVTEEGVETTIRFAHWLVGQAQATGSAILVSFDSRSLELKDASRLERAFQLVS
jgi:hypothetical protein